MGGTTSAPAAVPVQSGIPDPSFDQATSGVRITVTGAPELTVSEDKVQKAYNKGKEDGVATFQSSLEQVAAQVYDGVHTRLTEIQEGSLKRSAQLSEELKQKLTVPGSHTDTSKPMPCQQEQSVFLTCMRNATKADQPDPLACKDAVEAYSRCAMSP